MYLCAPAYYYVLDVYFYVAQIEKFQLLHFFQYDWIIQSLYFLSLHFISTFQLFF